MGGGGVSLSDETSWKRGRVDINSLKPLLKKLFKLVKKGY